MTDAARLSVEIGTDGYDKGTAAANRFADANKRVATEADKVTATTTKQSAASAANAAALEKEAERVRRLEAFMAGYNVTGQQVLETTGGMSARMLGFWAVLAVGAAMSRELDKEAAAASRAIAISGNYAGTTRGEMHALAVTMADVGTVSVGVAKDIVTAMVASGRISADALSQVGMVAENLALSTGKKVKEITPELIRIFEDPAKGAVELNKTLHALDPAFIRYIEQLQRSGQFGEAQLQLANKMNEVMPKAKDHLGTLETAWRNVGAAASLARDKMLSIGRPKTLEEQIDIAVANVKVLESRGKRVNPEKLDAARSWRDQLTNELDDQQTGTRGTSGAAAANQLANASAELVKQHSTIQKIRDIDADIQKIRLAAGVGNKLDAEQQEAVNKLMKDRASVLRAVGADARALADAQITAALKLQQVKDKGAEDEIRHRVKMGMLTKAEGDQQILDADLAAIKRQQDANTKRISNGGLAPERTAALVAENEKLAAEAVERRAKFTREAAQDAQNFVNAQADVDAKANQAATTAQMTAMEGLNNKIEAAKRHNALLGQTKERVEEIKAAELDLQIAELEISISREYDEERSKDAAEAAVRGYERQISKLRELKAVMKEGSAIEKAIETSKAWQTAAKNMQNAMSTFFFDIMQGNMTNLGRSFKRMVDQMLADAIAAQMTLALFGKNFSSGGGAGGLIGAGIKAATSFFAPTVSQASLDIMAVEDLAMSGMGMRANGGPVIAGTPYIVGERGPELMVPGQSGNVMAAGTFGGSPNIVVNVINKADPVSAKQSAPRMDAGQMVIDLVLQRMHTDANTRDSMRSALGPAT